MADAVTSHVCSMDTVVILMKNVLTKDIVATVSNFFSLKEGSVYQLKEYSKYKLIQPCLYFNIMRKF